MFQIEQALKQILSPEKVKATLTDRYASAPDASFYYLVPAAVVQPSTVEDVQSLFSFSHRHGIPLVFRTGGTSLSGQAVTDGLLVDLSRYWRKCSAEAEGELVRVQPGAIAAHVNQQLKKYQRKIGPDPASINAAMMGGILSNNSSGMCCGVQYNSYHTLKFIKFMLPDGKRYTTENPADYVLFEKESADLFKTLLHLRETLLRNTVLSAKIKKKYLLKNTVGYGLNALLDFDHPLDIFAHLLIGAEGTLAFIEEAVLQTLPANAFTITGLLYFDDPVTACNAIPALKASGAETLELMDRAALRSIEQQPDAPALIKDLPENATAILCEYQAGTAPALQEKYMAAAHLFHSLPLLYPVHFTTNPAEQYVYWKLRKGMYPSVAAARKKGTTVLLEDIAFPVERLGEGVLDIQQLMRRHGYENSIIFGHAKEGNLHFVMSQLMNDPLAVKAFDAFSKELASLVIDKYNGSLKGEHGTGRQVAPFVKDEWGEEAYEVMQAIKKAADPSGLLNPGVLLNSDPDCHIQHLKTLPVVEEEADKCIECGYCENRCPSRDYTLTPRQRIVVRRAVQRLSEEHREQEKNQLLKEYQFAGLDTCAVDGLCATDCPVNINTGELVKRLRRENHSAKANARALWVAKNFIKLEWVLKAGLKTGNGINSIFGRKTMYSLTAGIKKLVPAFPLWMKELSGPVKMPLQKETAAAGQTDQPIDLKALDSAPTNQEQQTDFIYFVSCITRVMGADKTGAKPLPDVVLSVSKKAGFTVQVPTDITGNCCGQPFSSKGFAAAYAYNANAIVEKLWNWTAQGAIPVVMDITSCTQSLHTARPYLSATNQAKFDQLTIMDSIAFIADVLLPKLNILKPKQQVVFHPVCSVFKMNLYTRLQQIGQACAVRATIPIQSGCCGMAGDRGFYYPGLTAAATASEKNEVNQQQYDGYYSSAKTCEMSLSEATGHNYQSLFYLLDEVV